MPKVANDQAWVANLESKKKSTMKKILFVLSAVAALTVAGCNNKGGTSDQYDTSTGASTNAPALLLTVSAASAPVRRVSQPAT